MRSLNPTFGLLASLSATAWATDAPVVSENPTGCRYLAKLPDRNDTTVRGAVIVTTNSNGTGADVQVSISGLPSDGGPFAYHIGTCQVGANLDCAATGNPLDPYDAPQCDPSQQSKCQVGALAGKHGSINGASFSADYTDLYLSLQPDTPAFIGNRSLVVTFANSTSLTCANFTSSGCNFDGGNGPPSSNTPAIGTAAPPTVAILTAVVTSTTMATA